MAGSTPAVSRRPRLEDNDYHINFHEVRYFKCRPISLNLVRYSFIFYFSAFEGHFGLVLIILILLLFGLADRLILVLDFAGLRLVGL